MVFSYIKTEVKWVTRVCNTIDDPSSTPTVWVVPNEASEPGVLIAAGRGSSFRMSSDVSLPTWSPDLKPGSPDPKPNPPTLGGDLRIGRTRRLAPKRPKFGTLRRAPAAFLGRA